MYLYLELHLTSICSAVFWEGAPRCDANVQAGAYLMHTCSGTGSCVQLSETPPAFDNV